MHVDIIYNSRFISAHLLAMILSQVSCHLFAQIKDRNIDQSAENTAQLYQYTVNISGNASSQSSEADEKTQHSENPETLHEWTGSSWHKQDNKRYKKKRPSSPPASRKIKRRLRKKDNRFQFCNDIPRPSPQGEWIASYHAKSTSVSSVKNFSHIFTFTNDAGKEAGKWSNEFDADHDMICKRAVFIYETDVMLSINEWNKSWYQNEAQYRKKNLEKACR